MHTMNLKTLALTCALITGALVSGSAHADPTTSTHRFRCETTNLDGGTLIMNAAVTYTDNLIGPNVRLWEEIEFTLWGDVGGRESNVNFSLREGTAVWSIESEDNVATRTTYTWDLRMFGEITTLVGGDPDVVKFTAIFDQSLGSDPHCSDSENL